jgi:hypothetical protein
MLIFVVRQHANNKSAAHNVIVHVSLRPSLEVVEQSTVVFERLASLIESSQTINGFVPTLREERSLL